MFCVILLFSGISIVRKSGTLVSFPGPECAAIPVPDLLSLRMVGLLARPSARLAQLSGSAED